MVHRGDSLRLHGRRSHNDSVGEGEGMTTIAFRDGQMAGDSRFNCAEGVTTGSKLFRKKVGKKEHLIGFAGDVYCAMVFIDWYGTDNKELLKQIHAMSHDDFEVLIWDGRKLSSCNYLCRPLVLQEDYFAIGSGGPYAITAMDCGKTAAQAVQMAIKRDSNSGGRIITMTIGEK